MEAADLEGVEALVEALEEAVARAVGQAAATAGAIQAVTEAPETTNRWGCSSPVLSPA